MRATLFHAHNRVELTAKQRQVLDLVARGRTNFEIAQELGISLDGAKWHLRELFTRLDVDSREEAAAWWREYNATPARFARALRALVPAGFGKWLIGGAASAAVVIGVAVALVVAYQHSDDPTKQPAAGSPTTAPATTTATMTPSASATPPPSQEIIAGLPVQQMSWGDPVPLPRFVVAWYWMARPYTDGGSSVLMRAWRDAAGELHTRDVLDGLAQRGITYAVGNTNMTRLFAAVCPEGLCGLGVSATPRTESRVITVAAPRQTALSEQLVFRSDDGGVSWVQSGKIPGGTRMLGVVGDQVLIGDYRQATPGPGYRGKFSFYPSGTKVTPPAEVADPYPTRVTDAGIQWTDGYTGGAVYDADGNIVTALTPSDFPNARLIGSLRNGQSFFTWAASENAAPRYMVRLGGDGTPQAIFEASTQWGQPISPSMLLGTVLQPESDAQLDHGVFGLAAFNLDSHTISPIDGLFTTTGFASTAFLATAITGAFAEVHTGGDCLNVRQEANTSSTTLGCFADGVLLGLSDVAATVEGVEWQSVITPSGATGWASAEYLVR